MSTRARLEVDQRPGSSSAVDERRGRQAPARRASPTARAARPSTNAHTSVRTASRSRSTVTTWKLCSSTHEPLLGRPEPLVERARGGGGAGVILQRVHDERRLRDARRLAPDDPLQHEEIQQGAERDLAIAGVRGADVDIGDVAAAFREQHAREAGAQSGGARVERRPACAESARAGGRCHGRSARRRREQHDPGDDVGPLDREAHRRAARPSRGRSTTIRGVDRQRARARRRPRRRTNRATTSRRDPRRASRARRRAPPRADTARASASATGAISARRAGEPVHQQTAERARARHQLVDGDARLRLLVCHSVAPRLRVYESIPGPSRAQSAEQRKEQPAEYLERHSEELRRRDATAI